MMNILLRARVLLLRPLLGLLFALWLAAPAQVQAAAAVVNTPQVRAELLAHAPEGLGAGKPMWLGLKIEHKPHWHTYWKNPGDSGLPTTLEWALPAGAAAGPIQWPTPSRLPIGPLMNYGFEGTLLLPVPLVLPAGFNASQLEVKLHAEWLVCKDVCIPESGDFVLTVPAHAATAGHAALFEASAALSPKTLASTTARATLKDGLLQVQVTGLPAAWQGQALAFFPETAGVIQNATPPVAAWSGAQWTAAVPLDPQRSAGPSVMPVVLKAAGVAQGVMLNVDVQTPWPAVVAPVAAALPPLVETAAAPAVAALTLASLAWAAVLAFLGGLLLNLMPCVFPVLSLKVLGFARQANNRPALLAGGLAYTAGVVLSFVGLAALLLALRAGGEQLGWGFQLQSPAVVAVLAALFTLIGLNLMGVFEFGSVLPSAWASARAQHPVVDSFLTGVLAVAVASPCTAPFMGASVGLALTWPAAQALFVFAVLGLGMALPYLLASAWPALARALPRPGVWMAHFKTVMAFPMFATVVWLVWVLGQQVGIDGAAALLMLLLAVAFLAWALGSPALGPRARKGFGLGAVALMALAGWWATPLLRSSAAPVATAAAELWQPWSAARVAQAQAEGQPVFVDFTAAWCVTCQVNKRSTLNQPELLADFEARKVLLLRADWTRRDATIAAELQRLGRSGVPVYVLYTPGQRAPQVLPELLTVGGVRAALAAKPGL